jgi:hypothetical protein
MKKTIGMMVLLISAATALVPAALAADRDDWNRDRDDYAYSYKYDAHDRRPDRDRDYRARDRHDRDVRTDYGRGDRR